MNEAPLHSLRDQPYELLRAMERLAWRAAGEEGNGGASREWVGIGFRLGEERFVAAREEVREVMALPSSTTRIPGVKAWVTGLANVRGQLLTVVDLKAFLGGAATRPGRETRVLVLNHRELGAGLLVDEVLGFRRFEETSRGDAPAEVPLRCERFLTGTFRQQEQAWPVFGLMRLAESPAFLHAAKDA
jgi:twitching motility protein PilI